MEKKQTRHDYHKEWRKKNPKKYALNQLSYWKRQVKKLEEEEADEEEADEEEKELVNV